jgi:hypothetical protein
MPTLFDQSKEKLSRLNQCYLCNAWAIEESLHSIEVPDQGTSYVKKLACQACLDKILAKGEIGRDP